MSTFFQFVIEGLTIGSFYALVALGYTMVYGIIRLINFAHGDLFTISVSYTGQYASGVTILFWPRSRNARRANPRLALRPVGAAKRKRLFARAARKETALPLRSAIMPVLF